MVHRHQLFQSLKPYRGCGDFSNSKIECWCTILRSFGAQCLRHRSQLSCRKSWWLSKYLGRRRKGWWEYLLSWQWCFRTLMNNRLATNRCLLDRLWYHATFGGDTFGTLLFREMKTVPLINLCDCVIASVWWLCRQVDRTNSMSRSQLLQHRLGLAQYPAHNGFKFVS